ncbi:putative phosphoglycerate mutase (putative) [Lactiplantibacillus plantarum]|nr:putative phosphoglycerate mutase (putative) [Lactiplantibacillus plantarum]
MKSITLHLVVAGATYFNQLDRFQGWSGTPLTATGEQATAKVAQQLASTTFDTAFASDTSRAIQTARIILDSRAQPVKLQTVVALRAPFYGGFEGTERAAVWSGFATKLGYQSVAAFAADQTPSELQTLLHDHDADGLAESGQEFWDRYQKGLQQVMTATPDHGQVLLVVDGATLRMMHYVATGRAATRQALAPSVVTTMVYTGDKLIVPVTE